MNLSKLTRRDAIFGAGASFATFAVAARTEAQTAEPLFSHVFDSDQVRRMAWWHAAKFGMFIHFGSYSQYGRHEWAMETQAIPLDEYQQFPQAVPPQARFREGLGAAGEERGHEVHGDDNKTS